MELDWFSYRCGVIDCFNEMVRAGLKPMALAHPCSTPAERDQYLPFCGEICRQYGTKFFPEDEMLLTDLFPHLCQPGDLQHHLLPGRGCPPGL